MGFYFRAEAADVTSHKGTGGVCLLGYDVDVFVPCHIGAEEFRSGYLAWVT